MKNYQRFEGRRANGGVDVEALPSWWTSWAPNPEDAAQYSEYRAKVVRYLTYLPEHIAAAVLHHYMLEMTLEETATKLGRPIGTVARHCEKGEEMLQGIRPQVHPGDGDGPAPAPQRLRRRRYYRSAGETRSRLRERRAQHAADRRLRPLEDFRGHRRREPRDRAHRDADTAGRPQPLPLTTPHVAYTTPLRASWSHRTHRAVAWPRSSATTGRS